MVHSASPIQESAFHNDQGSGVNIPVHLSRRRNGQFVFCRYIAIHLAGHDDLPSGDIGAGNGFFADRDTALAFDGAVKAAVNPQVFFALKHTFHFASRPNQRIRSL